MAKFTNVGTTGRKGPTTVGMHYQGQNHDGQVTVKKGIQIWKVPATGTYAIEAAGAAGGYDKFTTSKFTVARALHAFARQLRAETAWKDGTERKD